MKTFIHELKRRHVFRIAIVYAVVTWLVIQIAETTFPHLHLPDWTITLVIVLSLLGLPVALVLSWAFDLTPEGVRRTEPLPAATSWQRTYELFNSVIDVAPPEREMLLRRKCAADPTLYQEVKSLLAAHERGGRLDRLAEEVVSPVIAEFRQSSSSGGPAVENAAPSNPRSVVPSRYTVLERVGGGGMGVVYKACDNRLGRIVALKFLPPHLSVDEEAKARFVVEAQAAAALDHPNICTIHEIGEAEDGRLFIAMPFYDGETLKARIARGPLPIQAALDITSQVARGLGKAHERGIVHRDIKPANLVVTSDGLVKIVDFGIAKLPDIHLTKTGASMGTIAYTSPEQLRGEQVDARTDVWSLGVVLYEMLTGRRPFEGGSEYALTQAILAADPQPATTLRTDVPPAVDAVLRKALAKLPEERYGSVCEFVRFLETPQVTIAETATVEPAEKSRTDQKTGERIVAAPEAERRPAAIVGSSLVGYAALLERLPPDEMDQLMDQIEQAAVAVAEKHGGILNRFDGGDLLLLFGVPLTHEDDPLRAARAALELHERVRELSEEAEERVGQQIRLRSGLDMGLVIAQILNESQTQCRVTGQVVGIAARLAARAAPDELLVSPEVARFVAGLFETCPEEPLELVSGAQCVLVHRVVGESGLRSRLEATDCGRLAIFAGRDVELRILQKCLDKAMLGEGQFVTIVGEAGTGKSRLLHEFRRGLNAQTIQLLQGRCQAYDVQVSYFPFVEVLKDGLGLHQGKVQAKDDPDLVVSRIRALVPELDSFIPLYLHLLAVRHEAYPLPKHLEGEYLRNAMLEAIAAFVTAVARSMPLVLLLEDWHLADDSSREALKQVVELAPAYPLLVVATSRPTSSPDWGDPSQYTPIRLGPLMEESAVAIMKSVLGVEDLDEDLGRLVHERTGGNPFFIEEICHALLEEEIVRIENRRAAITGSIERLHLPDTVQAVIRSRLDRVDRDAREVLRIAATNGREFSRRLLEHVLHAAKHLPGSLETLKGLNLIQQIRVGSDAVYRFKHALIQEVAYDSLLEHQRVVLHGRVGLAIEDLYAGQLEEHLELLVHHFSQAGDWPRAVRYGLDYAKRASALSEFSEALSTLERVETWILKVSVNAERERTLIQILLQQERACETLGMRARQQEIIARMISLLKPSGDSKKLAEAYLREGDLYTLLRRFEGAETALNQSLRISRQCGDLAGERNALSSLGLLRWHEDSSEEAVEFMEQALAIDRQRGDDEALVGDLSNLGSVLRGLGEYEPARTCLEEALAITETLDLPIKRSSVLHHLGNIHRGLGEIDKALAYFREAYELTKDWPLPIHCFHLTTIAHIYLQQGKVAESIASYREAVDLSRRVKHADGLAQSLRMLGEVLVGLDRYSEALPFLREAADLFAQLEDRETEVLIRSRGAAAQEKEGSYAQAATSWQQVRELQQQMGNAAGELEALEGLARTTRRSDTPEKAIEHYQEALQLAERLNDRAKQASLLNSLGIVEWSRREYERALGHYEHAAALFEDLGDRVHTGAVLNSIGAVLNSLGRPAEAVARLEHAVSIHLQTNQSLLEGYALAALGESYGMLDKPELALKCYEDSLGIRREIHDRKGEGWMLYHMAQIRSKQSLDGGVEPYLSQAAEIATETGDRELSDACSQLVS